MNMNMYIKQTLIELCFFILCVSCYIAQNTASVSSIYLILITFCAIALSEALPDRNRRFQMILTGLCMIPAIYFPSMLLLLPAYAFPVRRFKSLAIYVIYAFLTIYNCISYPEKAVQALSMIIVALAIEELVMQNNNYYSTLIKTRDSSKEYELLLEEKNRTLMESQDANVLSATLAERNRIAREIHDNVGHMLTRSLLQTGALKAINKDTTLDAPLEELHKTLDHAMNNIRNSVHDLHDESINFESAIDDILQTADSFTTKRDLDETDNLPRQLKYAFIAIAKEAVNNAIKHSNGSTIEIVYRDHPGFYQFQISDDGSLSNINYTSGIGIGNMEERAKQIGGNLKINTERGFSILVSVLKNR